MSKRDTSVSCPVWTMEQILDPTFRDELTEHVCDLHGHVRMQFTDGMLEVSIRMAFLNLFWLDIPHKFGIPVCKRHFVKRFSPSNSSLMDAWTIYYDEILALDPNNAASLKQVLWDKLKMLYDLCCFNLLRYTCTLDILDMSEIMTDPKVAPIIAKKDTAITTDTSIPVVEKFIEIQSKHIMDLLGTKNAIKNDALYPYAATGLLNKYQLPQMMFAYGPRTDVDDTIVRLPVMGSAIDGLRSTIEFAIELLSAKKSSFYNRTAVTKSQYFGRKLQLLASSIVGITGDDCGSTNYVNYRVTKNNFMNVIGKNIWQDGRLVTIANYEQAKALVNTTIAMRSPLTCRHRNTVCRTCGGAIFRNIAPNMDLGILSAIHVIEPTTQRILSSKHLIKTLSLIYQIPDLSSQVLVCRKTNEIVWKSELQSKLNNVEVGFDVSDIPHFADLAYIRNDKDKPIKDEVFSHISAMWIRNKTTGQVTEYNLIDTNSVTQLPYLTAEFLLHFKDHYRIDPENHNRVWVDVAGTNNIPIFRFVILNDNMLMFVDHVGRFLSSDIGEYHSCSEALQAFSNIVHSKVMANIVHLEVLLKTYLITSPTDFQLPSVTNPNDVHFGTLVSIISNRAIGPQLGFQNLARYLSLPSTYLAPKSRSPFDLFVGYDSYK